MSTGESALEILVHPLVVMSIADHWTRSRFQPKVKQNRVLGLLFGKQDGRIVHILETVEIAYTTTPVTETTEATASSSVVAAAVAATASSPVAAAGGSSDSIFIHTSALEKDMKLFSAAYPSYEVLGWYSTGSSPFPSDSVLHSSFKKYNERPLYLQVDPNPAADIKHLPLCVWEETIHVVGDKTQVEFTRSSVTISADEAERVTVVHCAKVVTAASDESSASEIIQQYTTISKSITALRQRIGLLHRFLLGVKAGKVSMPDQAVLREVKGLCNRLPIIDKSSSTSSTSSTSSSTVASASSSSSSSAHLQAASVSRFQSDLLSEYNDALLVTYLAAITQGSSSISEVTDKFNTAIVSSKRGGGGGSMGGGVGFMEEEFTTMGGLGVGGLGMGMMMGAGMRRRPDGSGWS